MKEGDLIEVWWDTGIVSTSGVNLAHVLAIEPYKGKYKEHFVRTATLSAPHTRSGKIKMSLTAADCAASERCYP